MRLPLFFAALTAASPALAHPGHLGTLAGHDHWTLGLGLGAITTAAALAWWKGRKAKDEEDAEVEEETTEEEATA